MANRECTGLKELAAAKTLEACAAACCADAACSVYQFCAAGGGCDGATGTDAQCWHGDMHSCGGGTRAGWVGMGNGGPPPVSSADIQGVRIAHNSMTSQAIGTQATLSLTQQAATRWDYDFCSLLVFAQIAIVRVHVVAAAGFPKAVARPPDGCKVTVETEQPVSGTITVDVDSSKPSPKFA